MIEKKKKRPIKNLTNTINTMEKIFIAILKDNGENAPDMFVKKNDFVTDEPVRFDRSDAGWYSVSQFSLDGEGILPWEDTQIYFGNGNDRDVCKWAKLEGGAPGENPCSQISVFTYEAGGDGSFAPADGYLVYTTIKIVVSPTLP